MVYAFVLQNVSTKDDSGAIIYSEVFGTGMYLNLPAEKQRTLREEHLQLITARVNSEYRFKKACNIESIVDAFHSDRQADTTESGVFRLPVGKPLPSEKHVMWQVNSSCGFTMILSPDENKALAEHVLSIIIQYIGQIFKSFDQCNEMMANVDKIATILHFFLPDGQLIFMNHRMVKQLEKEMNEALREAK